MIKIIRYKMMKYKIKLKLFKKTLTKTNKNIIILIIIMIKKINLMKMIKQIIQMKNKIKKNEL